jgi:hypothetical protein
MREEINAHIVENVVPAEEFYLIRELDISACLAFWEGQTEVMLGQVALEFIDAFVSWGWEYGFLWFRIR